MPSPRSVLIVAYYFPPIGGIGSIRVARFAAQLPGHGWETVVLAPGRTPHAPDPHLHFPEDRVVRAPSLELSQLGRSALRVPAGAPADGADASGAIDARALLRAGAHRYLFFPDAQIGWYPGAVAAGLRLLRRQRFDAIFSSAFPMTAHLVARTLSRRAKLPWIAEYRDPVADRLAPGSPHRRRMEALERSIARDATRVVMPSPAWADHYGAAWHADIAVLPNGHDGRPPGGHAPAVPVLAHVGSYYPGEHDLTTIWQALARRRAEGSGVLPRLRFVGRAPAGLQTELARFGLADLLEVTGFLSHDDAVRELMSATALIASGAHGDDASRRGWVPAKLFDYLASGLPLVYVSGPDADAARLLTGYPGCHVVAPGDVSAAGAALSTALAGARSDRAVDALSREHRAGALAGLLDDAVSQGGHGP